MKTKVSKTISDYGLLKNGERVLVGLSGGADSTALLLVLKELGYKVSAIHINHNLRGEEAKRDEAFCKELCEKMGIPFEAVSVDVKEYAAKNSLSVETAARELRYNAFSQSMQKNGIRILATAHHAQDNLETALLNLTRGTALKGICGIPIARGNIVRPLLYCTRQEIENYLSKENQPFVVDSTNLDDVCARNKIRLSVLPVLSSINSAYAENFTKTSQILRDEEDFLSLCAHEALARATKNDSIDLFSLRREHTAVARRAVAKFLEKNEIEVNSDLVMSIVSIFRDGKINVKEDTFVVVKDWLMTIEHTKEEVKEVEFSAQPDNTYDFFEKRISLDIIDTTNEDANVHTKFTKRCLDYDKIKGEIFIRNRRNGDKVELVSRGFESKLKKLFWGDIPPCERDKTVILCDNEGIVFVEGYGAAQRVCVDSDTCNMLIVTIDRKDV